MAKNTGNQGISSEEKSGNLVINVMRNNKISFWLICVKQLKLNNLIQMNQPA